MEELDTDYIIQQKDCISLVLTWLYYLKANHWKKDATEVKPLKALARQLSTTDLARYWLFCYEALTWGSLSGQWRSMKEEGVSFIRKEIINDTFSNC